MSATGEAVRGALPFRLRVPRVLPNAAVWQIAIGTAIGAVLVALTVVYAFTPPQEALRTNLLARLPQLPEQLDYRITGRHLLLRDADANLIVDYIPNVIK